MGRTINTVGLHNDGNLVHAISEKDLEKLRNLEAENYKLKAENQNLLNKLEEIKKTEASIKLPYLDLLTREVKDGEVSRESQLTDTEIQDKLEKIFMEKLLEKYPNIEHKYAALALDSFRLGIIKGKISVHNKVEALNLPSFE